MRVRPPASGVAAGAVPVRVRSPTRPLIFLDYETRSRVPLTGPTGVGGHAYAEHPSTELLCCVALDVREAPAVFYVWTPFDLPLSRWQLRPEYLVTLGIAPHEIVYAEPLVGTDEIPEPVLQAARDGVHFCAHNAWGFDRHIWNEQGLPITVWEDTIPLCRRRGLPADLERVGQTLFGLGKDRTGARVMRRMWAPMKAGKMAGEFRLPDGPRLSAIVRYCVRDVALMAQAYFVENLDAPHPDDACLAVHEKIDARGVAVDLPLTRLLLAVDSASALSEAAEAERLTNGEVTLTMLRSPVALVKWLASQGVKVDNVQAPTMRGLL